MLNEALLATIAALVPLIPVVIKLWSSRVDRKKLLQQALAAQEAKDADASMARTDAELERVRMVRKPDGGQP